MMMLMNDDNKCAVISDFFGGKALDMVDLAGLDHVFVFTAVAEKQIMVNHCSIQFKKSGQRVGVPIGCTHVWLPTLACGRHRELSSRRLVRPLRSRNAELACRNQNFGRLHSGTWCSVVAVLG